ncbi:MAG: polyphosphate kinase 2 family protein [Bacteroidetes bacterium]|nr:polyphosphate kinase 2 family protein [Bacteroidota bacterium]
MENLAKDPHIFYQPGSSLNVNHFACDWVSAIGNKDNAARALEGNIEMLARMQDMLYASARYAVLVVFQAMDAAGKDGTIKHVMSGFNPQGTQVFSFKAPTPEEVAHDYFWRTYKCFPAKGQVVIFNRSYYEEVLVTRVHPGFLLRQRIPGYQSADDFDENFWQQRFRQINDIERHLTENGTVIIKFFLNISKDQQKRRFLRRLDDPARNWKFEAGDLEERRHWDKYMHAYSEMLAHTSTGYAPWYVIPADRKWFMRYAVSNVLLNRFGELELQYPELPEAEKLKLVTYRNVLMQE